MLDNQIIPLIINTIIAQEAIAGINGTPIKQAFQPTMQGVNLEPTAYIHKIGDRRYGYPLKLDVWDSATDTEVHTETQQYETTFQVTALSTQDPTNTNQYTASDILNLIAYCLQSAYAVQTFEANNVGILRVMDVRNVPFIDDRNQYEYQPSFDFVMTHKQTITSTSPILESTELQIITI